MRIAVQLLRSSDVNSRKRKIIQSAVKERIQVGQENVHKIISKKKKIEMKDEVSLESNNSSNSDEIILKIVMEKKWMIQIIKL